VKSAAAFEAARLLLRKADDDLESLRTQVANVFGPRDGVADKPENQPILDAWTVALDRYRDACRAYVEAARE
jgi:hypothetical protein